MTPALFATLAASCAIAILLVVELHVPLGGIRRWLQQGPHVETTDDVYGPWFVVRDRVRDDGHPSPGAAASLLSPGERVRAWLAELATCPWCAGAYCTAAALGLVAFDRGADVLWFWGALWFTSAALVVAVRRLAE